MRSNASGAVYSFVIHMMHLVQTITLLCEWCTPYVLLSILILRHYGYIFWVISKLITCC